METIFIVLKNAFISSFFYIQNYFFYFILLILFVICGCIEFHEKQFLFVDDERKVI